MTRLPDRPWAIGRFRRARGRTRLRGFRPRAYSGINYADTDGIGVSALGFLPIQVVDVYGRLGLFDCRANAFQSAPYSYSFHGNGSDLTYGGGVGMHWGNVGARLEYEATTYRTPTSCNLVSLGVVWSFF